MTEYLALFDTHTCIEVNSVPIPHLISVLNSGLIPCLISGLIPVLIPFLIPGLIPVLNSCFHLLLHIQ